METRKATVLYLIYSILHWKTNIQSGIKDKLRANKGYYDFLFLNSCTS